MPLPMVGHWTPRGPGQSHTTSPAPLRVARHAWYGRARNRCRSGNVGVCGRLRLGNLLCLCYVLAGTLVHGRLQLRLGLFGQRRLQDGAAELGEPGHDLICRHLASQHEDRRTVRLHGGGKLLSKRVVDPVVGKLAGEGTYASPDGQTQEGHKEEQSDQESPHTTPASAVTPRSRILLQLERTAGI